MQIDILGSSGSGRSVNVNAGRRINLFPVLNEDGKSIVSLLGTPGLRLLATLGGSGGIRAVYRPSSGDAIAVCGYSVYRLSSSWVATFVGYISTLEGPVSIADNGTSAVLVDGTGGYVLPLSGTTMTKISSDGFYGADVVQYVDGYFVFNRPGTQQFYISALLGTTFDALDFASAEGAPDLLVSLIVDHREVWMFGESSTEIFTNTGNADFPFERMGNAFIEHGCAAAHGVAKIDNTVFWIGKDASGQGIIWRAQGYVPQRVSDHQVEYAIQNYERIDDCVAYSYQQEGHSFVVFCFPTANATWVYDCATQKWHERASRNPVSGALDRHRSNCHMFFGGVHVVGDWETGKLYALDLDCYSDNGEPMPAILRTRHIAAPEYRWIRFNSLQVDIEAGVGEQHGQGKDPVLLLRWSDDGGHAWSNEHQMTMGAVGRYMARARKTRLGRSRDRVFELSITDPVKRVIISASVEVA